MNVYTNQISVSIAEMARIICSDIRNGQHVEVGTIVMPVAVFENLVNVMEQTLNQYKEAMAKQALENKKLS